MRSVSIRIRIRRRWCRHARPCEFHLLSLIEPSLHQLVELLLRAHCRHFLLQAQLEPFNDPALGHTLCLDPAPARRTRNV